MLALETLGSNIALPIYLGAMITPNAGTIPPAAAAPPTATLAGESKPPPY